MMGTFELIIADRVFKVTKVPFLRHFVLHLLSVYLIFKAEGNPGADYIADAGEQCSCHGRQPRYDPAIKCIDKYTSQVWKAHAGAFFLGIMR